MKDEEATTQLIEAVLEENAERAARERALRSFGTLPFDEQPTAEWSRDPSQWGHA